jgi:glycosyltransferase involved in cell wall biosynthesis
MSSELIPAVSVIVPNYNHAPYLRRRIESILQQTYQDFELILLDDSSTDHSREILQSYAEKPGVKIAFNTMNSGSVFKQWNKGIRMARGRYIWIAESDDYSDTQFLGRMVSILEGHPDITFVYCASCRVGEDEQHLALSDPYLDRLDAAHWAEDFIVDGFQECQRFLVLISPVANASAVVFRKDVYERIGCANERLRVCGDYKVWADMALEGKVAYVAEHLNYFRSHLQNVRSRTRSEALDVTEYFYVMLSVLDRVAPKGTLPDRDSINEILGRLPSELTPAERIRASKQSLSIIGAWNLQHQLHLSHEVMRAYFADWNFALVGREFELSPPSRWQFFLHRCRFYLHYFNEMSWRERLVNLLRIFGAPLVGYRRRHWPEKIFGKIVRELGTH